jgi:hypothetical protein
MSDKWKSVMELLLDMITVLVDEGQNRRLSE